MNTASALLSGPHDYTDGKKAETLLNSRPAANTYPVATGGHGAAIPLSSFQWEGSAAKYIGDAPTAEESENDEHIEDNYSSEEAVARMEYSPPSLFDDRIQAFDERLYSSSEFLRKMLKGSSYETEKQEKEMSALVTPVKIIGGLLGVIATLLTIGGVFINIIYSNLRSDLDDLKKSSAEVVKTVANVDKQVAVTNTKLEMTNIRLEDILKELQKSRR